MERSQRALDRTSRATGLLRAWGRGDLQARDDLLPLVYGELRQRAAAYLRRERGGRGRWQAL